MVPGVPRLACLLSLVLLVLIFTLGHHTASISDYGSCHHVYYLWFQAPCLSKRTCASPNGSEGSIHDHPAVHPLSVPCPALVQNI
jgi:hypothetical protein